MAKTDDAISRPRRLIDTLGGPEWRLGEGGKRIPISVQERQERVHRAIPLLLDNARLLRLPTCPELDEPVAEAKKRAERMRAHNVRALWLIYRDQTERGEVDERVARFFAVDMGLQWRLPRWETVAAMEAFIGKPHRGRRRDNAMRDFELAAEIEVLREGGKKVEEAYTIVCQRLQEEGKEPDERHIENIYRRETKNPVDKIAVRAWVRHLNCE